MSPESAKKSEQDAVYIVTNVTVKIEQRVPAG